jgi:hypothetical protein
MSQELLKKKRQNYNKTGAAKQRKEEKQKEALMRQESYSKLTVEQKVAKLDAGNFSAKKQRKKLLSKGK